MTDNGDQYGYDPDRQRKAAARDLFERLDDQVQTNSKGLQQLGKASGLPRITPVKKRLIEASVAIREEAPDELTYQHTVLCQTAIPSKRPPVELREWERRQGRAFLKIQAGDAIDPQKGEFVKLGLPFGPKSRLILMHLNAEAIRAQSPVIEAEDSLTAFIKRILNGNEPNGREIRTFKDQLSALSAATIRLAVLEGERAIQVNTQIVGAFDLWFPKDSRQRILWPSTVRLSADYFNSLLTHAVPLDERAIAALSQSALALDVYCWLAQRLHRVPDRKPQFIPWPALYEQFGQGYTRIRDFRAFFLKTLRQVKSAYPAARFDADGKGMILWNSPAPVQKRLVALPASKVIEHQP